MHTFKYHTPSPQILARPLIEFTYRFRLLQSVCLDEAFLGPRRPNATREVGNRTHLPFLSHIRQRRRVHVIFALTQSGKAVTAAFLPQKAPLNSPSFLRPSCLLDSIHRHSPHHRDGLIFIVHVVDHQELFAIHLSFEISPPARYYSPRCYAVDSINGSHCAICDILDLPVFSRSGLHQPASFATLAIWPDCQRRSIINLEEE